MSAVRGIAASLLMVAALLPAAPANAQQPSPFPPADLATGTSPTINASGNSIPMRPEMLSPKPERFAPPPVSRSALPNGIHFYVCSSPALPSVYFVALLRAGSRLDPPDKVGLARLTADALRAGGTESMSADEFDRHLDEIGAKLSVSADREFIRVSMFTLASEKEAALKLLSDLLLHPAFDEGKLQQQKALMEEEIRRQNDEPADIARREFRKVIYGNIHPLGRSATIVGVQALTRADVLQFYGEWYRPASMWLGFAGDIPQDEAQRLAESAFGAWAKPPAAAVALPPADDWTETSSGVWLVNKPGAQAQIRFGHLGLPRNAPEQYAAAVFNSIYGTGGFSSRLMQSVRTKHGYAYGVGGAVTEDDPRGVFFAAASSKTASAGAALREMLAVTTATAEGAFDPAEVETAKKDTIHSFVTRFDVPREVVSETMRLDMLGYPADYVEKYPERIRAVTSGEISQLARTLIQTGKLRILLIGDPKAMDVPPDKFGTVTEVTLDPAGAAPPGN